MTEAPRAVGRFVKSVRVPFSACDPAGIMFFAQYHIMFQNLVDDWVTERLGISYAELLGPRRVGLPTVRLETDFRAPTRMGDGIRLELSVEHLGRTSLVLGFVVRGDVAAATDTVRVQARQVIVCTHLDHHTSMPFPDDLRAAIEGFRGEVA